MERRNGIKLGSKGHGAFVDFGLLDRISNDRTHRAGGGVERGRTARSICAGIDMVTCREEKFGGIG
ncbi:hypothetical protein JCM24511_04815 [Saitozyma sp. JCM 24511]|nr:hypothetical protein JCM24511_04815 [Saitozyma sp. JCM 24511]